MLFTECNFTTVMLWCSVCINRKQDARRWVSPESSVRLGLGKKGPLVWEGRCVLVFEVTDDRSFPHRNWFSFLFSFKSSSEMFIQCWNHLKTCGSCSLWSSGNNTQQCIYIFHSLSTVCLFIALIPTLSSSLIPTTTLTLRTNKWNGLISAGSAKHHRLTFTVQGSPESPQAPEGQGAVAKCLPTGCCLIDLMYQHRVENHHR